MRDSPRSASPPVAVPGGTAIDRRGSRNESPIGRQVSPDSWREPMNAINNHDVRSGGRIPGAAEPVGAGAPIQVTSGAFLCRLHVWTDQAWDELPEAQRPREYVHAPGL